MGDPEVKEIEQEQPELRGDFVGERVGSKENYYEKAKDYWNEQDASLNGVTGGYGEFHQAEAEYSLKVFNNYKDRLPGLKRTFEVAAGIGRVTKFMLNDHFEEIDILD